MHLNKNYGVYIFDCDGVIFDSNTMKINAMKNVLVDLDFSSGEVGLCIDYFSKNFGKSRFFHVDYFIENYLNVKEGEIDYIKEIILKRFSDKCKNLYLNANLTPGFLEIITCLKGCSYIASGSDQEELRDIFQKRGLSKYFKKIYGSPVKKTELVRNIIQENSGCSAIMIGDSVSDFLAAKDNNIDFICYLPYSNVKEEMISLSKKYGFNVYVKWPLIK